MYRKKIICNKNLFENYEGKRPHRRSTFKWNVMLKWFYKCKLESHGSR